jgi:hypothetical protein
MLTFGSTFCLPCLHAVSRFCCRLLLFSSHWRRQIRNHNFCSRLSRDSWRLKRKRLSFPKTGGIFLIRLLDGFVTAYGILPWCWISLGSSPFTAFLPLFASYLALFLPPFSYCLRASISEAPSILTSIARGSITFSFSPTRKLGCINFGLFPSCALLLSRSWLH